MPAIQSTIQMKPSAPVTMKAACQPNIAANGITVSGARILPRLGAVLTIPSAIERCRIGRYCAAALTAAGVLTDSAATRTTRAVRNWVTLAAKAWAMPATLQITTAAP